MPVVRVLIDTNIVIPRENDWIVPDDVQKLMRCLADRQDAVIVHPASVSELSTHKDERRRSVTLSKAAVYAELEAPPNPEGDASFYGIVPHPKDANDKVDDALLYAVQQDAVDILVSNDGGIQTKAGLLGLQNRVLRAPDASHFLQSLSTKSESAVAPEPVVEVPLHTIRLEDPFFDSLKLDYDDFEEWFRGLQRAGVRAWIYRTKDGPLGAFMLLKDETEAVPLDGTPLPKRRRVKIRTLKVTATGYRLGELFVKIALEFAYLNGIHEMYVTVFAEGKEPLLALLGSVGFRDVGRSPRGDRVFLKHLHAPLTVRDPKRITREYYPSLAVAEPVRAFVIPIKPRFHARLFPAWHDKQLTLFSGDAVELVPEGNAITKAYLCNSRIRAISPGDVVFFYRSLDTSGITSVGTVEGIYGPDLDPDRVLGLATRRIVYTSEEIASITSRSATLLLFRWHFHLAQCATLSWMLSQGILRAHPQSVAEISREACRAILQHGGIDDRFVVD